MTPDVNVLVAAARRDHAHHETALAWLVGARVESAKGQRLLLLPGVGAGFVRIVTNSRVFDRPTPIAEALAFMDVLIRSPGAELAARRLDWNAFSALCREHVLSGNDIADAIIAVEVLAHHESLVTFDKGFRRFLGGSALQLLKA